MGSRRLGGAARWLVTLLAVAGIIALYRSLLQVNPTTVALTLVLCILLLAARLGLRYAVVASLVATAGYNFFFLPPVGTFAISDPQNWLALFTFLGTGVIGSRLSQTARDEADHARAKQRELELLFTLSRDLLQTEDVAALVDALPRLICTAARGSWATLYLLGGDQLHHAGPQPQFPVDTPRLRQLALCLTAPEALPDSTCNVPLRAGARPRGLLCLGGVQLPAGTLQAIGDLASIALDRAEALHEVAHREAEKKGERLRTLILDSITHELKTPLTSIKGAASTLLSAAEVRPEDRLELLAVVDEEADRLNRLISQATELAQIESQEVHLTFRSVALAEVIAQARQSCTWVENTHPLTVRVPPSLHVCADAAMLAKVVGNLLQNAANYSAPGSPIVVTAQQDAGTVTTSIADRGIGIDSAEQELIFDRLYRSTRQKREVAGTGMGLSISRAIIEAHRGTLWVNSQVDHGSVFSFTLPTG